MQDLYRITAATAALHGADLGDFTDVEPAVRFGSTPRSPALVRVTTTVEVSGW